VNKNFLIALTGLVLVIYGSSVIATKNTIYYYTTSETNSIEDKSQRLKLGGFVMEDTIGKENSYTKFKITDGNKEIQIMFDGFIPDLFQENMGVILDGKFEGDTFFADDMLVKHDNEYISNDGESYNVENYEK
jgi:cytochrome c-type biogenesis protein CcmE